MIKRQIFQIPAKWKTGWEILVKSAKVRGFELSITENGKEIIWENTKTKKKHKTTTKILDQ